MPDPAPRSNARLLWPLLIALLLVLTIIWMLSPSGDTAEPGVDDPIVIEDPSLPAADIDALDLDRAPPPPEDELTDGPPVDREPAETPLPVPAPAAPGQPAPPPQ